MRTLLLILLMVCFISPVMAQIRPGTIELPPAMKKYDSPYYIIHTDLGDELAKETQIRLSRMAEEYYERTKDFSGRIRVKFPFYLFARMEDYINAGAVPGSAGVFMGDPVNGFRLMAFASDPLDARTWQVVQHEGFHQFAHAVIGGDMPIWANEGLAEYFGEAIFTGDGFVTGVIPPWRLERVKKQIQEKRFMTIESMMRLSHVQWNMMLDRANYDQAWAMVHFLAHGDGGKYQKAFGQFMNAINKGADWQRAWMVSFGSAKGFEERFTQYWTEQPENPTETLYFKATALTLGSYLARAHQQGQTFENFETFLSAARSGGLRASEKNWLPASVLKEAVEAAPNVKGEWSLETVASRPQIVLKLADQTRISTSFVLKGEKVDSVKADVDDLAKIIAQARKLAEEGKKPEARQLVMAGLKENLKSPFAEEARKLAYELKQ